MTRGVLSDALDAKIKNLRDRLRGVDADPGPDKKTHMSGMLLRSALISGWPGLALRPRDENGDLLKILRMERLSETVLLCLFYGVPSTIELSEPQEGFRFGVDEQGDIELRNIEADNPGKEYGTYHIRDLTGKNDVLMRPGSKGRILNLDPGSQNGMVQMMTAELNKHLGKKIDWIKPADFAVQMVKSPQRLEFKALS